MVVLTMESEKTMSEKVTKHVEVERLERVFKLIDSGQHPKVIFSEDIESMRAEAEKVMKETVFEIGVALAPYMDL